MILDTTTTIPKSFPEHSVYVITFYFRKYVNSNKEINIDKIYDTSYITQDGTFVVMDFLYDHDGVRISYISCMLRDDQSGEILSYIDTRIFIDGVCVLSRNY